MKATIGKKSRQNMTQAMVDAQLVRVAAYKAAGARGRQQFDGLNIDANLIFGVAAAHASARLLIPKAEELEAALGITMDNFFRSLVRLMGNTRDLWEQTRAGAPWQNLSKSYVKRKGSAAFYIYTGLGRKVNGAAAQRRGLDSSRASSSPVVNATLIKSLARLSGNRAFGRVIVSNGTAGSFGSQRDERKTRADIVSALQSGRKTTIFTIRLWTALPGNDFATVETFLQRQGLISQSNRDKLVSRSTPRGQRPKPHRPLIQPYMAHYARTVLPQQAVRIITGAAPSANTTFRFNAIRDFL